MVIHLLQVAFESFENDVLRICWHRLHFWDFLLVFFYFRRVYLNLISAFGIVGKDIFYFRGPDNRLWLLIDLGLVSWLLCYRGLSILGRFFTDLVLFLFQNFLAFLADLRLELWSFLVFFFKPESQSVESLGFKFYLICQKLFGASHVTPFCWDERANHFFLSLYFFLFLHLRAAFHFLANHRLLMKPLFMVLK